MGETKDIKKKGLGIWKLVFVLGLAIAIYPLISNLYYRQLHQKEVTSFIKGKEDIDRKELEKKLDLARNYNRTLDPSRLSDPYTDREKEARAEYARMIEVQEMIGFVEVPQIDQNLPVYAGTSDQVLEKGAGHLEGTSLPIGGKSSHSVVTAHRGLPRAKLFRELDKLKEGDIFYFHNIEGVLAYQVDQILTVEPWDFEPVLVVEGEDYMTLLTCTPYMVNSHRLLVRGHRVEYVAPVKEKEISVANRDLWQREYLPYILGLLVLLLVLLVYLVIDYRKALKKVERMRDQRDE